MCGKGNLTVINEKIVRKTKVFSIGMKVNEEYLCRKYLVGRG